MWLGIVVCYPDRTSSGILSSISISADAPEPFRSPQASPDGLFGPTKPCSTGVSTIICRDPGNFSSSPISRRVVNQWVPQNTSSDLTFKEQGEVGIISVLVLDGAFLQCNPFKQPPQQVKLTPQGQPRFIVDIWQIFIEPIPWSSFWAGQVPWGIKVWSQTGSQWGQLLPSLPDSDFPWGKVMGAHLVVMRWWENVSVPSTGGGKECAYY